ncbi:AAA family ATPase [Granulosicoccus sp. 3-233]|uniref:AAA family ATPase n=1 Tax=Granulosicoccus sp. 3-233 TaxID=3417969 RepID=UPI003D356018
MRFEKLNLRRFGHFTDFELAFGPQTPGAPDLHVLFGPNEAGKSTTLAAITDLLYGIKRTTPWNFLHDNNVLEIEATLEQGTQSVTLKRFKNHWANASDTRLERFPLDLQGLTRDDYARRFSFDEQTLQAGGEQILNSDGDVGQALFSASAGLANLKGQMDAALSDANAFWMPNKRVNLQLTDLKKELTENKKRMDAARLDTREWKKRCDKLEHATLRRDKHRQLRDELQLACRQLEKRQSAQALAAHYRKLIEQRDALAEESVVPLDHSRAADFLTGTSARQLLERVRDQLEDCRLAKASRADMESRVLELQERLAETSPDESTLLLVQSAERIRTLAEESAAVYEWQQQQTQCQNTIAQCAAELDAARERLTLPSDTPLENRLPGDTLLTELQQQLDQEQTLAGTLRHARQELDNLDPLPEQDSASAAMADVDESAPDIDVASELLRSIQKEGLSNQILTAREALLESRHTLDRKSGKFGLSIEQLSQLDLPDTNWLNGKLGELSDGRHQLKQLQERIDTLSTEIRTSQDRCKELMLAGALDPARLLDARESRDDAWSAHSQGIEALLAHAELRKTADLFEKALGDHDALLAQAASSNQATAELQLLQMQLLRQQQELQELTESQLPEQTSQQEHRVEQLKHGIAAFHDSTDIDPDLLRNRHAQLVGLLAEQEAIQAQELAHEKLELKASDQCRKLLTMLAPLQSPARQEALARLSLDDLLTQAGSILETLGAERNRQQESARALTVLIESHAIRQKQLETATLALADWQKKWESLTQDTLFSGMPLSKARDSLSWVAGLAPLARRHRDAIRELENLSGRLATRDKAIAQLLQELNENSLTDALQHLQSATAQVKEHESLQAQLKALQQQLEKNHQTHASSQQAVESLRQELGTESEQALLALLTRTEQHRLLNDRCKETLSQLRDISDADNGDEDIERLYLEEDAEALEKQLGELNAQLKDAGTTYDESSEAWALANRELEDIGDENAYAGLNQERQNLILQTMDLARQCAIARTGQKVLNAAMARFRQEHQSVILTEAQQAFSTLTGGRYVQLLPRDDGNGNERLFVIDQQRKARAVTELSTGTRYQLYLALRAAAHADYANQRPPLPFVADDIMESFDDERAGAAFQVLAGMAEKGQVIYLTHHQHLLDLARKVVGEDRVHIHHFQ